MSCMWTDDSPQSVVKGTVEEVETILAMNRHWKEALNTNLGNDHDYKMTQILIESESGLFCSYPGRNLKLAPDNNRLKTNQEPSGPYQIFRLYPHLTGETD